MSDTQAAPASSAGQAGAAAPAKPAAKAPPAPIPFTPRLAMGLFGILLAAMASGLNGRVPGLALAEISGLSGISHDQASWLSALYSAGEMVAMPFSSWFAITFSLRRFHLLMLGGMMLLALVIPCIHDFNLMATLRFTQGVFSGALIPMLMMSALRFLPPPIRLHGLALYAMTATLAPNVGVWLAALVMTDPVSLQWIYWNILPLGCLAAVMVFFGIPKLPLMLPRMKQGNWWGMALGMPGLAMLGVGVSEGVRLEWFHSPLDGALLIAGGTLAAMFLYSEWHHPTPFMRLQMLGRRNLGLGFAVFLLMLIAMSSAVGMPMSVLAQSQGLKPEQMTALGLIVGLPQIFLGSVVAMLLYQRWVDARYLFVAGLLMMATACFLSSRVTSEWMVDQFFWSQVLNALGQPIAVVCMLFLGTSVVQPMEGPFVSGIINTLRALGTLLGGAFVAQMQQNRGQFHHDMLLNQAGLWMSQNSITEATTNMFSIVTAEAAVLANADIFRIFMVLILLLIPAVLYLQHIPAPVIVRPPAIKPAASERQA